MKLEQLKTMSLGCSHASISDYSGKVYIECGSSDPRSPNYCQMDKMNERKRCRWNVTSESTWADDMSEGVRDE